MKSKVFKLCFIFCLAIFSTQCFSNSNQSEKHFSPTPINENSTFTSARAGASDNTRPAINSSSSKASTGARVEGDTIEIKIDKLDLDNVLQQPAPKVWFVFDCREHTSIKAKCTNNKLKRELPPEAELSIEEFWKQTLTILFKFYPSRTSEEKEEGDLQYHEFSNKLESKLVNLLIDAPEGKRRLTYQESNLIIDLIIERAKPIRDRIEQLKAEQNKK